MKTIVQRMLAVVTLATPLLIGAAPLSAQTFVSARSDVADSWSRYVDAETVYGWMQSSDAVQILDIRKPKYVDRGIIPDAITVPFSTWRGPSERPSQPPSAEELATLIGENGLRLDQPIVIYHRAGKTIQNGRAAIVYWILKSAGAKNIAILEGGIKAWQAADLPIAETATPPAAYTAELDYQTDWWADPMDIYAITSGQSDGAILDARLDGQIRKSVETGEPIRSMPMAQYIPASFFTNTLSSQSLSEDGQNAFVAELQSRGIVLNDQMLISICQTGELSALSWFYASEILGIENVRYYPDALKGWESDGGLMFGMRVPDQ